MHRMVQGGSDASWGFEKEREGRLEREAVLVLPRLHFHSSLTCKAIHSLQSLRTVECRPPLTLGREQTASWSWIDNGSGWPWGLSMCVCKDRWYPGHRGHTDEQCSGVKKQTVMTV